MIGRLWILATTVTVLAVGAGCMKCRHTAYQEALYPPAELPHPPPVRNQVFLFMMNGHDVLEHGGMLGLRDQLCHAGYPMVYYAQRADREWYNRELRRVARDNPGARLLLLGYGSAASAVNGLAYEAARDELPLDSVIYLDPVWASGDLAGTLPYHSVAIRSHNWRGGGRGLNTTDTVEVANIGHYALPNHSTTVDVLVQLMTTSAGRVTLYPTHGPRLPLRDKPDPTPRGIDPATIVQPLDEWDFLKPDSSFPILANTTSPGSTAHSSWWCEKP